MCTNNNSDEILSSELNSLSLSPRSSTTNYCSSNFLPAIQINGRKIIGPPEDWKGPIPSNACELFLKKIPRNLNEYDIVPHLLRFGPIYEFRLMMEFNEHNRGYGYVKYRNEEDASRAKEVLNHFYIIPGKIMEIQHSYDKCRLFVGNIPKQLSREDIESAFREEFPMLERIVMHNRISDKNRNRGFVFIDFPNHQEALKVKKQTTPGLIRKWGRDLKIVWANPERSFDPDSMRNIKTLFIRNVDLSVNTRELWAILIPHVKRSEIRKISRVREFAFIDFVSRDGAEKILRNLQGTKLKGYELEIEWAMPPCENSIHTLRNNDFDAILRLKCIANYWSVPVIIFGRVFESDGLQYAAVLIRGVKVIRAFFVELETINLSDIQSRLCEVIVTLIEQEGGLPSNNYVIKIQNDTAHIVGAILDFKTFSYIKAANILQDLLMYWDEIKDLSYGIAELLEYTDEQLLNVYENIFQNSSLYSYIQKIIGIDRIFGCLQPNYRAKPPLKYKLNNAQIILVLCHTSSSTNYIFPNNHPMLYNFKDVYKMPSNSGLQYFTINLLPKHFAQSKQNDIIMSTVYYGVYNHKYVTQPAHYMLHDTTNIPSASQSSQSFSLGNVINSHLNYENYSQYYIPSAV